MPVPSPANRSAASVTEPHASAGATVATAGPGAIPLLRQRLRGRFAALSVVGAMMVALPLLQVLRYQTSEVETLVTERAGLDPVGRAVDVQRSLLLHRDLAAAVLRGQAALEAERQQRQGEVDDRVGTLAVALANGAWDRAIKESDALREDWSLLVRQVTQRSVNAQDSDLAHRLLMEQTLQVIDLVADATLPNTGTTPVLADAGDDTVPTLAAAHALPRLAWQLALLAPAPAAARPAAAAAAADQSARDVAAAEASLARALGAMNRAVDRQQAPAAQLALAHASASAGAAADQLFTLLRQPARARAAASELQAAADNAVQAQLQLFDLARTTVDDQLGHQVAAAEQRRSEFVSAMAVLALMALGLISSLARRLQHWQGTALAAVAVAVADADAGRDRARDNAMPAAPPRETQRLLQRLRDGDAQRWPTRSAPPRQPLDDRLPAVPPAS